MNHEPAIGRWTPEQQAEVRALNEAAAAHGHEIDLARHAEHGHEWKRRGCFRDASHAQEGWWCWICDAREWRLTMPRDG